MPPLQPVRPGDLITAQYINTIIDAVNRLETAVNQLQGSVSQGQAPVITRLVSSSTPIRIGQQLQVIGTNFATPANRNLVSIGGSVIQVFDPSSTSTKLVFSIPNLSFSDPQLNTIVTVWTLYGTASATITLLPAFQIPQGHVVFSKDPNNKMIGKIEPDNTYQFGFSIDSQTDPGEDYRISYEVVNVTGNIPQSTWETHITLFDEGGKNSLDPGKSIHIEPSTPLIVKLEVQVPSQAHEDTDGFKIRLHAVSVHNPGGLSKVSSPILDIVIGHMADSPYIGWVNETQLTATGANKARRVIDTKSSIPEEFVEIPYGGSGTLTLSATFAENLKCFYDATVILESGGAWGIDKMSPPDESSKNENENEPVSIVLSLLSPKPAGGGNPEQAALTITATGTLKETGKEFTSIETVNIRGYDG